jgi:hypothetical protein
MSVKEDKRVFFKNAQLPALMGTPLKIMVGVSLACISLACLVYVLDVYDRYRFEQRARNQCYDLLQLEQKDLIIAKPEGATGARSLLQYCLARARFNK